VPFFQANGFAARLPNLFIGGTFNIVKISFDPPKRRTALNERGLDFADAESSSPA
jgi:hypothetical protein